MEASPSVLHEPVMLAECLEWLRPRRGAVILDATLGTGGHAEAILRAIGPEGTLVGLDRDPDALRRAEERLRDACAGLGWGLCPIRLARADFRHLADVLDELGVERLDGALFDLGVSSMQLEVAERGFSFRLPGPLDMRMDPASPVTAADLVNRLEEDELARILREYGEERYARRIARRIVERRREAPFRTTTELAELVRLAYPAAERRGRIHPATRTFQALRIAVNQELTAIEPALVAATARLSPGARLVVLAYHSLEDRIVKRTLEYLAGRCRCPEPLRAVGRCACGARPWLRVLTRKPVTPSPEEVDRNPRARSARLRAAERLPDPAVDAHGSLARAKNQTPRTRKKRTAIAAHCVV